jgi:tRNA pseudouridine55 synthase
LLVLSCELLVYWYFKANYVLRTAYSVLSDPRSSLLICSAYHLGILKRMFDGLLLVDKPKGWTSFDVVAKVRGVLRRELKAQSSQLNAHAPKVRVGHTGTLDPLATGLLVLTLGKYCKRAEEFSKLHKTYEVTMKLGWTSSTGDEEGIKTKSSEQRAVSKEEIEKVLEGFTGEIMQTPPAYSAVKIGGQRAYKLARAGKEVKLEPRKVTIYQISNIKYSYPKVTFIAKVSSGTYIRSLVEDIGKALGLGAYMTDLRRTSVGDFGIDGAISPENISQEVIYQNLLTK